jgi:hypothetical protein
MIFSLGPIKHTVYTIVKKLSKRKEILFGDRNGGIIYYSVLTRKLYKFTFMIS